MVTTVALPNLTRDQAVERAAFVTVESYHIKLDLTDRTGKTGEHTYHSVTTVEFDALAGADTYIDIAAQSINSATLNGREIDVSDYDESAGIPLTGLAEHNVVVVDVDCVYSKPVRGCTGSSTRSIARCTCTRSSKRPMPSACSPASTSPPSRRPSTSPSPRRHTGRSSPTAPPSMSATGRTLSRRHPG